jgi:glutamate-1-semialdehyde 2,1-aminomutase
MPEKQNKTQELYKRAKKIIPGGTQLLSKRPEMMAPGLWPAYFSEAKGCECVDLDGKHYYDFASNGIGACLLGFNHPDVSAAVIERVRKGSMCTLNPPEEVELAERLLDIHPWAERARFARCGGEAMSVAVRIARATTGRSVVAFCGYHGWHDWYLAANLGDDDSLKGHLLPGLAPCGVPSELRGTALTFRFNRTDEFMATIAKAGSNLAAVVMEPCRHSMPEPEFIKTVKAETAKAGALLIFDEITIGWRLTFGGSHLKTGVSPDMAVFAKALGNGHPISAVIGTAPAMAGAEKSFISSTYWTESAGPAAAVAALKAMKKTNVSRHVRETGEKILEIWTRAAAAGAVKIKPGTGFPCLASFTFDSENANTLKTLLTQEMLKRGFLAGTSVYPTLAHNEDNLQKFELAVTESFIEIGELIRQGGAERALEGPEAHTGFARLN